jgi:hypothetical protein
VLQDTRTWKVTAWLWQKYKEQHIQNKKLFIMFTFIWEKKIKIIHRIHVFKIFKIYFLKNGVHGLFEGMGYSRKY